MKEKLRSAFISAFSGNPQENIQVYTEVGYYYMCCAPSSLYKYYSDRQEKLETVKHNKMWYSAPCNFNDVFDCDMSMDEEGIFQSILQMYPDKEGYVRKSHMERPFENLPSADSDISVKLRHIEIPNGDLMPE